VIFPEIEDNFGLKNEENNCGLNSSNKMPVLDKLN